MPKSERERKEIMPHFTVMKTLLCVILCPMTRFRFYLKCRCERSRARSRALCVSCFFSEELSYATVCASKNKMQNVTESSARSKYGTIPNEWNITNNASNNKMPNAKQQFELKNSPTTFCMPIYMWITQQKMCFFSKIKKWKQRIVAWMIATQKIVCAWQRCRWQIQWLETRVTNLPTINERPRIERKTETSYIVSMALGKLDSHTQTHTHTNINFVACSRCYCKS